MATVGASSNLPSQDDESDLFWLNFQKIIGKLCLLHFFLLPLLFVRWYIARCVLNRCLNRAMVADCFWSKCLVVVVDHRSFADLFSKLFYILTLFLLYLISYSHIWLLNPRLQDSVPQSPLPETGSCRLLANVIGEQNVNTVSESVQLAFRCIKTLIISVDHHQNINKCA